MTLVYKRFFFLRFNGIKCITIVNSCAHHEEFEDEDDEADGPDKAAELAYRKNGWPYNRNRQNLGSYSSKPSN